MYLEGKEIQPGTGHEAGRQLLAEMYLHHIGAPMPEILLTQKGKPYFADSPWHFSISHTNNHVFCALSRKNIGIDAEEEDRPISVKLASKILSEAEYCQYARAEDPRLALLIFWVLKEAQGKLTGEGIKIYPNHTNFSLEDPRVIKRQGCLVAVLEEDDDVI